MLAEMRTPRSHLDAIRAYGLSNATQTVVPAPTRPYLLMASSPLRMYHQDLWRAVTPTRKYEGYATKPASSGRETLIPYDT